MPDHNSTDTTRIDIAQRLDAVLDAAARATAAGRPGATGLLPLPAADPLAVFVSLAAEISEALQRPVLSDADRARIHGRVLDAVEARGHIGLRLPWPQLGHRPIHPAVIGGAAAAVLAVVGVAALQRRGHGAAGALQAA